MILLKIKVKRQKIDGGTRYTYPPQYDASKIQVMCYESSLPENYQIVMDRGNDYEYLIGAVKDIDAPRFLSGFDVEQLTELQTLELGNQWTKPAIIINDPEKVIEICQKIIANISLTQIEKDAIDPSKSTSGIIIKGKFIDAIANLKSILK